MDDKIELILDTEVKRYKQSRFLIGFIVTSILILFITIGIITTVNNGIDIILIILCFIIPVIILCINWIILCKDFICNYRIIKKSCTGKYTAYDNDINRSNYPNMHHGRSIYYLEFGKNSICVSKNLYNTTNKGDKYYILVADKPNNKMCRIYQVDIYTYNEL